MRKRLDAAPAVRPDDDQVRVLGLGGRDDASPASPSQTRNVASAPRPGRAGRCPARRSAASRATRLDGRIGRDGERPRRAGVQDADDEQAGLDLGREVDRLFGRRPRGRAVGGEQDGFGSGPAPVDERRECPPAPRAGQGWARPVRARDLRPVPAARRTGRSERGGGGQPSLDIRPPIMSGAFASRKGPPALSRGPVVPRIVPVAGRPGSLAADLRSWTGKAPATRSGCYGSRDGHRRDARDAAGLAGPDPTTARRLGSARPWCLAGSVGSRGRLPLVNAPPLPDSRWSRHAASTSDPLATGRPWSPARLSVRTSSRRLCVWMRRHRPSSRSTSAPAVLETVSGSAWSRARARQAADELEALDTATRGIAGVLAAGSRAAADRRPGP